VVTAPCTGQGDLMQDPDRQDVARYVCFTCPRMYACREWAFRTDVDGVCGGTTPDEREQWRRYAHLPLPRTDTHLPLKVLAAETVRVGRRVRNPELLDAITRLSRDLTGSEIAERLGITERTVVRYRAHQRHCIRETA
jgi:hypothetical protein